MKLINADTVFEIVDRERLFGNGDCGRVRKQIEDLPEAVVRCMNCIYWDTQDQTVNMIAKCNYYSAERYCVYTNSKDYCSGGERKTE